MEPSLVITALASVIASLAGFIAVQFRSQLADKDKQIEQLRADRDKQLAEKDKDVERWRVVAQSATSGLSDAVATLQEVQGVTEAIERQLAIRKAQTRTQRKEP